MCVQNLDDSRGFAIRITYRISLRSSSLWEPRHPLLKVVVGTMPMIWLGTSPIKGKAPRIFKLGLVEPPVQKASGHPAFW